MLDLHDKLTMKMSKAYKYASFNLSKFEMIVSTFQGYDSGIS